LPVDAVSLAVLEAPAVATCADLSRRGEDSFLTVCGSPYPGNQGNDGNLLFSRPDLD
jgi:hypothetical protein